MNTLSGIGQCTSCGGSQTREKTDTGDEVKEMNWCIECDHGEDIN